MTGVQLAATVFVCGAFYEASCVGFVHFSGRGNAGRTAAFSGLTAACEVTGLLESVRDWRNAPAYVLGYMVGSYLAVRIKRRGERP